MARNDKLLASALAAGPKSKPEEEAPEENALDASPSGLQMAAEELLSAIEAKDARGVESALRSAFDMLSVSEE
jgi:hypothetical protein